MWATSLRLNLSHSFSACGAYYMWMQYGWRLCFRGFARSDLNLSLASRPGWRLSSTSISTRRAFHSETGAIVSPESVETPDAQPDWADELDRMAQRRLDLLQLQQILGLAPSQRPVQDVVFVCIDCEAYEFDQTKVTEIGR